jgi:TPR repeat protein
MVAGGTGIPKDEAKAVEWYEKAAAQGHAEAQNNLGVMYDKGKGVPQDQARAVEWYRKAAAQGNPTAQYNLAIMYADGIAIQKDELMAYAWFNLSAAKGNKDAAKRRDALEKQLTPEQKAQAQKFSADLPGKVQER